MLMSSTNSLHSDKFNFYKSNNSNNKLLNSFPITTPSTPITTTAPVNLLTISNETKKNNGNTMSINGNRNNSTSLISIPNNIMNHELGSLGNLQKKERKSNGNHNNLNRSYSEDTSNQENNSNNANRSTFDNGKQSSSFSRELVNQHSEPIAEFMDSDDENELKSSMLNNEATTNKTTKAKLKDAKSVSLEPKDLNTELNGDICIS
jgi:hypothetical protein